MTHPFKHDAAQHAVTDWWYGLEHDPGAQAHLRRIEQPEQWVCEDATSPGKVRAKQSLLRLKTAVEKTFSRADAEPTPSVDLTRLAAVAGLLAQVRSDAPEMPTFAACFTGGADGAFLSERRFERLVSSVGEPLPYDELRRVVQQVGRHAPVGVLAGELYDWGRDTCERWADVYYARLLTPEAAPETAETVGPAARRWWADLLKNIPASARRCNAARRHARPSC